MAFDYNKLPECERRVVCVGLIILTLFLVFAGFNQLVGAVNSYRNGGAVNAYQTVSFSGEGKVKAAPDTAKVEIGLSTEGKDSISYNKGKSTLAGYILNQSLSVTIRDIAKVGDILDGAVSNGANQINSISMLVDRPEELRNKAREEAVKQAKEKAKITGKTAGFRLGRIIGFSENSAGEPPMFYEAMGMGGAIAKSSPQIEPGSQDIAISVTLTYLIK
ncbi:MAG: hypothetical protein UV45_C0024G0003 [Candidatus Azambacteria bacterium GW2011_GWB1_42_72]|nr:MAG: hypothetical protein UV45_C0024G0003 [Candidatus Azambacteria bacterium GW2011_GWB1_42_72]